MVRDEQTQVCCDERTEVFNIVTERARGARRYSSFLLGAGSAEVVLTGPTSLTSPYGIGISSCAQSGMAENCTYSNTTYGTPYNVQTLNPGAYSLYVSASATGPEEGAGPGGDDADVTLSFAPSPVPIPASGALLLSTLGILGLMFSRHERHGTLRVRLHGRR
jgi:hypothetical protein